MLKLLKRGARSSQQLKFSHQLHFRYQMNNQLPRLQPKISMKTNSKQWRRLIQPKQWVMLQSTQRKIRFSTVTKYGRIRWLKKSVHRRSSESKRKWNNVPFNLNSIRWNLSQITIVRIALITFETWERLLA